MDIITAIPAVAISLLLFSVFWIGNTSKQKTQAISELQIVKEEFRICDVRILETAKNGSYNTCSFSVEKGELVVGGDIIYYKIIEDSICDVKDWTYLGGNRLKEKCTASDSFRLYEIEWNSPTIMFQRLGGKKGRLIEFRKLSDLMIGSESGSLLGIRIL